MIRGNWSLANDLKNAERKHQSKLQKKQKHHRKLETLSLIDPIRLHYQIEKLTKSHDPDDSKLKSLQEDWDFIIKHKLHDETLGPFLADLERKKHEKQKQLSKLWGPKSPYFNPELNPLGKVPTLDDQTRLPNCIIPVKNYHKYPKDPVIDTLNIVFPNGDPPKFYKTVQNVDHNVKLLESEQSDTKRFVPTNLLKRRKQPENNDHQIVHPNSEYDIESQVSPEEEQYLKSTKKTKHNP
jgi:hypothetical protein